MGAEYSVSMVHVASPRGIDGTPSLGRTPDSRQLLYAAAAWVAFNVGGVLQAFEPKPFSTKQEFAETERTSQLSEQTITKALRAFDSDEFGDRQGPWHQLHDALWEAFDTEHNDVDALLARIKTDPKGKKRIVSAEQRSRIEGLEKALSSWRQTLPGALGQVGIVRGDEALDMLRSRVDRPFAIDAMLGERLATANVDLTGERKTRNITRVLAKLCNETSSKPHVTHDNIRLIQRDENEYVIATDELLASVVDYGHYRSVDLYMQPGRGQLLAMVNEHGFFEAGRNSELVSFVGGKEVNHKTIPVEHDKDTRMRIPPSERPYWEGQQTQMQRNVAWQSGGTFDAIVADTPQTIDIAFSKPNAVLGFQEFGIGPASKNEDGTWRFTLTSQILGNIPWMDTSLAWDMPTYAAADANRYMVRGVTGKEMQSHVSGAHFNMRTMQVTITCPEEPASMSVRAYTTIHQRTFASPVLRPKRPRSE